MTVRKAHQVIVVQLAVVASGLLKHFGCEHHALGSLYSLALSRIDASPVVLQGDRSFHCLALLGLAARWLWLSGFDRCRGSG